MKHIHIIILLFLMAGAAGCQSVEQPAPERVDEIKAYPGIGRVRLFFKAPERAVSGKVYYNAGAVKPFDIDPSAESQAVDIDDLQEGETIFRVVTLDAQGRESEPKGVVVTIYGSSYNGGRFENRKFISLEETGAHQVKILFAAAGSAESYVVITYSDLAGQVRTARLMPEQREITISDIDTDLDYTYHTVYKPTEDFLDEYCATRVNIRDAALMQLDKTIWIMSATGSAASAPLEKMVDDDPSTSWRAASLGAQTITVDMQTVKYFSGIIISQGWDLSEGTMPGTFTFEVSNDAATWTTLLDKKLMRAAFAQQFPFDASVKARYFRLVLDKGLSELPIQMGEIDLYNDLFNTYSGEISTLPAIVNATLPIQSDGSEDLAAPVGVGRMQRAVGWEVSDPSIITTDTVVGGLCIFTANAWNIPNVINGKVWQTFDLLPGYYNVAWTVGSVTDRRGVDAFGVVATGSSLPDISEATSAASVIASFQMDAYSGQLYNLPFEITEPATVAIGWVFTTYDLYAITGSVPWSDLYINGIELTTR